MKEIKINDYVLVIGEGSEVFRVTYITRTSIILHTGVAEPKKKCTLVPKEFHNKLNTVLHTYLDFDSIDKIMAK